MQTMSTYKDSSTQDNVILSTGYSVKSTRIPSDTDFADFIRWAAPLDQQYQGKKLFSVTKWHRVPGTTVHPINKRYIALLTRGKSGDPLIEIEDISKKTGTRTVKTWYPLGRKGNQWIQDALSKLPQPQQPKKQKPPVKIKHIFPPGSWQAIQRVIKNRYQTKGQFTTRQDAVIKQIIRLIKKASQTTTVYEILDPKGYFAIEIDGRVWFLNVIPLKTYGLDKDGKEKVGSGNAVLHSDLLIKGEPWQLRFSKKSRTQAREDKELVAINRNNKRLPNKLKELEQKV